MGTKVPFHSYHCNFMVYQNQLETNLLQLFAHSENSKWLSIISVIFEVNIVAANIIDYEFLFLYEFPLTTTLTALPLLRRPWR